MDGFQLCAPECVYSTCAHKAAHFANVQRYTHDHKPTRLCAVTPRKLHFCISSVGVVCCGLRTPPHCGMQAVGSCSKQVALHGDFNEVRVSESSRRRKVDGPMRSVHHSTIFLHRIVSSTNSVLQH
jgi:hypothetical protein